MAPTTENCPEDGSRPVGPAPFRAGFLSEQDYLDIIGSSSEGLFIHDLVLDEMHMSPQWKERLGAGGMTPKELAHAIASLVHPDDYPRLMRLCSCALDSRLPKVKAEFRIKTVDTGIIWVLGQVKILYGADGRAVKYLGTHIDITEQKRIERNLRQRTEELQRAEEENLEILDGAFEGSWVADIPAGIMRCSKDWSRRIGLDLVPERDRLACAQALIHPDDTKGGNSIQDCIRNRMPRFDLVFRVKAADGGFIWTQNRGKIRYDEAGNAIKVYAATTDITGRVLAEEALRSSRAELEWQAGLFDAMLVNSTDFYVVWSRDRQVVYANRRAQQRWGCADGGHLGKTPAGLGYGPEHAGDMTRLIDEVFETGRTLTGERTSELKPEINYEYTYSPVFGTDGSIAYVCSYAHDITQRKKQEELLSAQTKLLEQQADELEKKNRLVTDFFINVSHEFKTPLSILMLGIDLLEKKAHAMRDHGEIVAKPLTVMRQNGLRLGRLVANLLDITKLDAGFMEPRWEKREIVSWLDRLVKSSELYAVQKGLDLSFTSTESEKWMFTDGFMLDRILLNLLSNAVKHTPPGGRVGVICAVQGSGVEITVQDNGEGIPKDKQCFIFDRFRQVDSSLSRASEGCGIGLAITRSLAELMGGGVRFTSEEGCGSAFTVTLPALDIQGQAHPVDQSGMHLDRRVQMEFADIL